MIETASSGTEKSGIAKDIALLLVPLVILAGAMSAYWLYPFPGGKHPSIWGFIALFFREALLLAFFGVIGLVLLVTAMAGAVYRLILRLRPQLGGSL